MAQRNKPQLVISQVPTAFVWARTACRWKVGEFEFVEWRKYKDGTPTYSRFVAKRRGGAEMAEISNGDPNLDDLRIARVYKPDIASGTVITALVAEEYRRDKRLIFSDAWEMRSEFLTLKPGDMDGLLTFLNRWGRWSGDDGLGTLRLPETIWRWHKFFTRALLGGPKQWFGKDAARFDNVHTESVYPHVVMEVRNCDAAISGTITLDLLRQVRFRLCARRDCQKMFRLESKHERRYCSQYCGHLESVRRRRGAGSE